MTTEQLELSETKQLPETEKVLIDAAGAAKMLDISRTLLYQLISNGRLGPRPIRLGPRCTRFVVEELKRWAKSGCPSREQWLQMKENS